MLIDIIAAILMVIACLRGYQKGLILAIFSILAYIVGLAAALKLSAVVAGYLEGSMNISSKWLPFVSFIAVFLITVLLVRWGGKLIERSIQLVLLGWINRLGGIILFAVLYLIILSIFVFYAEKLQLLQPAMIRSSQTYAFIQPWGPKVINGLGNIIPIFKDLFVQLESFFNGISNKVLH